MSAILTRPPSVEPVGVPEAKAHLRVTHGDDDEYISTLIKTARTCVEQRTGLALMAQGWSLFLDDWPVSGIIMVPLRPVIDVADIRTHGEDDASATIDPAHYYANFVPSPARIVLRGSRDWARPARAVAGIEILLTLGFGETTADVPAPLREAVLQLLGHWYARRGDEASGDTPFQVDYLLQPYRQVRL